MDQEAVYQIWRQSLFFSLSLSLSFLHLYPEMVKCRAKLDRFHLEDMKGSDLVDMLKETEELDEHASIIHYLWMKLFVFALPEEVFFPRSVDHNSIQNLEE